LRRVSGAAAWTMIVDGWVARDSAGVAPAGCLA
jgi:hypothetical protein